MEDTGYVISVLDIRIWPEHDFSFRHWIAEGGEVR
jgi:hypothetical protein